MYLIHEGKGLAIAEFSSKPWVIVIAETPMKGRARKGKDGNCCMINMPQIHIARGLGRRDKLYASVRTDDLFLIQCKYLAKSA